MGYNVALNGVVMLAVLLRIFAAKVPILRNPFEGLVRSPLVLCLIFKGLSNLKTT